MSVAAMISTFLSDVFVFFAIFILLLCVVLIMFPPPPDKEGPSRATILAVKAYTVVLFLLSAYGHYMDLFRPGLAPTPMRSNKYDGWMLYALKFEKKIETPEQRRALYELLEKFPGLAVAERAGL